MGRLSSDNTKEYAESRHPLYKSVKECKRCRKGCGLKYGKIMAWEGKGKILFVASQPDWNEHPDNSESEQRTMHYAKEFYNLRKDFGLEMYPMTNLVKCATILPNEDPTKEQVFNCLPWLAKEVRAFNTKLLVFVGRCNYKRYGKAIKTILNVETTWCYHYSPTIKNRWGRDYSIKQRKRMRVICNKVGKE